MNYFPVFYALPKGHIVRRLVGHKAVGSFVCIALCNAVSVFLATLILAPAVLMLVVGYAVGFATCML